MYFRLGTFTFLVGEKAVCCMQPIAPIVSSCRAVLKILSLFEESQKPTFSTPALLDLGLPDSGMLLFYAPNWVERFHWVCVREPEQLVINVESIARAKWKWTQRAV